MKLPVPNKFEKKTKKLISEFFLNYYFQVFFNWQFDCFFYFNFIICECVKEKKNRFQVKNYSHGGAHSGEQQEKGGNI